MSEPKEIPSPHGHAQHAPIGMVSESGSPSLSYLLPNPIITKRTRTLSMYARNQLKFKSCTLVLKFAKTGWNWLLNILLSMG